MSFLNSKEQIKSILKTFIQNHEIAKKKLMDGISDNIFRVPNDDIYWAYVTYDKALLSENILYFMDEKRSGSSIAEYIERQLEEAETESKQFLHRIDIRFEEMLRMKSKRYLCTCRQKFDFMVEYFRKM